MVLRSSEILSSTSGIKACPPKPGKTLINKTIYKSSIYGFRTLRGMSGFTTKPGLQPRSKISDRDFSGSFEASG